MKHAQIWPKLNLTIFRDHVIDIYVDLFLYKGNFLQRGVS